jgi:hypothetical protein
VYVAACGEDGKQDLLGVVAVIGYVMVRKEI